MRSAALTLAACALVAADPAPARADAPPTVSPEPPSTAPAAAPAAAPEAPPSIPPAAAAPPPASRAAPARSRAPWRTELTDPAPPPPAAPARRPSRAPEITASIITGGLVTATVLSVQRWNAAYDRRLAGQWQILSPEEYQANIDESLRWKRRSWGLFYGTLGAAGVTAFLWTRHQTPRSFSVLPAGAGAGAAVTYGGRF